MLECSWFLMYMTLPSSTVSYVTVVEPTTRLNKVNIDLKTYVDIDDEDKDADLKLSIQNQKLKGDVKFIISNNRDRRREFTGKKNNRFTEFMQNAIVTLQKYNDRNLKYFWSIFDEEIKKYHYRNCKFFELTGNPDINKLIAHKLQTMKDDSADTIRYNLAAISNDIEDYNRDESKKKLIDFINALYTNTDVLKFKRFLLNLETFNIYNGKVNSLRKIIQEGIRSIVFDHYTELHKAARQEIKYRIEEYFQNILKPSTTLLAEITNSMFLDFHISGEKNKREFTTEYKRENLRINKHDYKYNPTKYPHTKNENIEKVKKKTKKIKIHDMERTIIKSELQFDEMYETITQTNKPNHVKQHTSKNKRNKKEQDTRILKNKRSSEEKELTHSKFITDRTITKRQTSKWHLTLSPTKKILRTSPNRNVEMKTTSKKDKKPSPKFAFIEIVTMRPFSPRKTTSFGNIHYMIELDKNTAIPKDFSALRAKILKPQTKIPGILFGKVNAQKRVIDNLKEVTTRSTQEHATSVIPKFRFAVRTAPMVRSKNIQFRDESTVGFYRRIMNPGNDISVTKLTTVSPYTNGVHHFEGIKDSKNEDYDRKSSEETIPFLRNTDFIKETTQEKVSNSMNLRINFDDYVNRINTTRTEIKENIKDILEIKSTYGKTVLKDRRYYSDGFIRGKMDPAAEFDKLKIATIVSNPVKAPITYTHFKRIEKDDNNTQYSNIKRSEMPHFNSLNNKNTHKKSKKREVNFNNIVLYTKVVENAESKHGNLKEKKLKSKIVNYRKGANRGSHNYKENLNNSKHVQRKEINEMSGFNIAISKIENVSKQNLPPKGLRQSLPEPVEEEKDKLFNNDDNKNKSVEVTKKNNKKDIDLKEYQAKALNSQVKSTDKKEVLLTYNSRFTIESRQNSTLLLTSNMPDIAEENKISTNQDVRTRKSKWSKIKNYVFNTFTGKYAKSYSFDAKQSHNKELNINSDEANKDTSGLLHISLRSINEKTKEIDTLLVTSNTIKELNTTYTNNKILQPNQFTPEDNKMYRNDFGTLQILNPSKEITASDLEKMEPIARKQEELSMLRKLERKVKLDPNTTTAGIFGRRRFWEKQNTDQYDEGQTETTGQMEDKEQKYQLVPEPKDPNVYLYMQNY